ncbi:TonB-dependent receptor domain-containing protein [Sphingobium aromaticivastans]|uniref:TonB-dependent receptor domain-containing protein n=2 Tax=Sphingobium TaxID=165695 RepID=UPI00159C8227
MAHNFDKPLSTSMRGSVIYRCLAVGMVSAIALLSSQAFAQATGESGETAMTFGDIIVTAQKREQKLQDVGLSITALGGDMLQSMGVRESVDVVAQVPNVQNISVYGPGMNPNFSIRGVSLPDFNDFTESSVSTYNDEIYLVANGAGSFPAFDLNRVEVLRGPQGTLFGRNTTGGIVHFISNKPTSNELLIDAEAEYGRFESRRFTGVINAPLGDGIAVRFAGIYQNNDPWIKNDFGQPDSGAVETYAVRSQLGFDNGGPFKAIAKFEYGHAEGPASCYHHVQSFRDPVTGLAETPAPSNKLNPWRRCNNNTVQELIGASSYNGALNMSYDFGDVTLTSVTGFNHYGRDSIEDYTFGPYDGQARYQSRSEHYSQELRLSKTGPTTDWTMGLYYLHQNGSIHYAAPVFAADLGGGLAGPPFFVADAQGTLQLRSYGLFGNLEHHLTDQLSVAVGARWTKDNKHFQQDLFYNFTDDNLTDFWPDNPFGSSVTGVFASNIFTDAAVGDLTRLKKGSLSAKAQLNYKPTDNSLVYASVSRGTKGAGFNNGFIEISAAPSAVPYKAELAYVYEAGVKTDLLDRKLTLNGSVFYYDYKNYHAFGFGVIGGFITNKKARLYGAELELSARPFDGLMANIGLGLLDSTIYDVTTPAPSNVTYHTREMALAPAWSLNGLVRYEFGLGSGTMAVQGDFKATSKYQTDILNNPATVIPSYEVFNGRIEYRGPGDSYRIALFCKNLLNSKYRVSAFDLTTSFSTVNEQFAPPRWWGISIGYKFRQ